MQFELDRYGAAAEGVSQRADALNAIANAIALGAELDPNALNEAADEWHRQLELSNRMADLLFSAIKDVTTYRGD
jgi:hypothetical protein